MPSRPLKPNELSFILNRLSNPRDKALILLGIRTGFRVSELISLRWCDIVDDTVTVARKNMKGKRVSRTVPMHPEAKDALNNYLTTIKPHLNDKIFPISRVQCHRILRNACILSGVKGKVSMHSLRKSFGMGVYERTGHNLVAAQKALGHASLASTGHYLSVDSDTVDQAILSA